MSFSWFSAGFPPLAMLFGQLLIGLINGSFYAMLSLGLAIIFGLLNIVNFVHGSLYMLGAFLAYLLLTGLGIGYWPAMLIAPLLIAAFGVLVEKTFLKRIYKLDHIYGMLLTFGISLVIEGSLRNFFGATGRSYPVPAALAGGTNLGFMFLPTYRGWVVSASLVVCLATWFAIEKTRLGAYLRAATENPLLTRSFGIRVPLLVTGTYAFGAGLAALTGVLAAPIYQISTLMGSEMIIVVFAVVVIGGMGSIGGAILGGYALGLAEGLSKVIYPEASTVVVFAIMILVLIVRPAGLFGKVSIAPPAHEATAHTPGLLPKAWSHALSVAFLAAALLGPLVLYPTFLMKILCFGLFASAFNLLAGYCGLISFGHAAYFGSAAYLTGLAMRYWDFEPLAAILLGTLGATVLGLVFGWLSIRRQGIYFAMVTLALAQSVYFLALQSSLLGRDEGIHGVPRGMLLGLVDLNDPLTMYYLMLAVFIAGYWFIQRVVDSPFGQVLKGISESEARMISLGYEPGHYKLLAFVLSAGLSGLAGALYVLTFQIASISNVHWSMSGQPLLMTLIGGLGTTAGPLVGAIILSTMENQLSFFGPWIVVVQGAIFIVCILAFRRGIVGECIAWMQRRGQSQSGNAISLTESADQTP